MLSVIMMYAISASTCFFGKQLMLYSSPLFISGIRTLIAGAIFLLYAWYEQGKLPLKKLLFPCLSIGIYSFFLSNTFKFWALQHCSTFHASLISLIEPLLVSIMAYILFRERVTITAWIGIALCMASSLVLAMAHNPIMSIYELISIPSLFLCIAITASVYGALLMRKLIVYENAPTPLVMGISMANAGVWALVATITEGSSCSVNADSLMPCVGYLTAMIVLGNIVGYALYGKLVNRYSAVMISCGSFARPIFTALYSVIIDNGALPNELIIATLLLITGLWMLGRQNIQDVTVINAL